jgi:hypothetical protein
MKLSDIDKNLNESPVGILGRAATKLKKNIPFAKKTRARNEVRDAVEKAANQLALEWQKYVGTGGIDRKAITPEQLYQFLKVSGYLKTGQPKVAELVKDKEHKHKMKAWQKGYDTRNPTEPPQRESLEARLAMLLVEAEEYKPTFTEKEVEALFLDIVQDVAKTNAQGLIDKVEHDAPEEVTIGDTDTGIESETGAELTSDQLEQAWDQIADNLPMSDEHKEVFKVAFDNAAKKIKAGKVAAN